MPIPVLAESNFADDGKLGPGYDSHIGSTFYVDRETGVLMGAGLSNSGYPERTILDPGSDDNSFKLIWASATIGGSGGSHHIGYLEIREWAERVIKPFVLVKNGTVLTGTCI